MNDDIREEYEKASGRKVQRDDNQFPTYGENAVQEAVAVVVGVILGYGFMSFLVWLFNILFPL